MWRSLDEALTHNLVVSKARKNSADSGKLQKEGAPFFSAAEAKQQQQHHHHQQQTHLGSAVAAGFAGFADKDVYRPVE